MYKLTIAVKDAADKTTMSWDKPMNDKPAKVVLTLVSTVANPDTVTVIGTKEIVVP